MSLVGAALGPFTGGASIGIAAVAVQAISMYEKADAMDWSNPGAILQGVGEFAGQGAGLVGKVVDIAGDAGLKEGWTDLQDKFKGIQQEASQPGGRRQALREQPRRPHGRPTHDRRDSRRERSARSVRSAGTGIEASTGWTRSNQARRSKLGAAPTRRHRRRWCVRE